MILSSLIDSKCSSYKVCTECYATKILGNDLAECISSGSDDTSGLRTFKVPTSKSSLVNPAK